MKTVLIACHLFLLAFSWLFLLQTYAPTADQLPFEKNIDFKRFMGVWYNIASLPDIFQRNCRCGLTFDTLQSQLVIDLSESCLMIGRNITSKSKAVAPFPGYGNWTNYNGPFPGQYWVLHLDTEYNWVIIGQPSRKGFWIMSRKPTLQKNILNELMDWGRAHQFDLSKIQMQDQSCFTE